MRSLAPLTFSLAALGLAGCGGIVNFSPDGDGGSGGDTSSTSNTAQGGSVTTPSVTTDVSSTSNTSSTSTGISPVGGGGPGLTEEEVIEGASAGTISVTTQPGDLGVTAFIEADGFSTVAITEARAPSGSVVVSDAVPSNGYSWVGFGSVAMAQPLVEHPETFPFAQGTWSFDYEAESQAKASAWVRRTVDGNFHGGVLDINVFIPEDLIDDDDVLETFEEAFEDWGGITLGDVRFFPISDEYYIIDDDTLFGAIQETEKAQTRPALNIIATGEISGSFEGAAGFALGIPGLPLVHGTLSSAVVWMVFYDEFIDGLILRHEAGHFAGLFHTSEFQAGLGDTLSDTPLCENAEALFEQCPDYEFAMFPSGGSGQGLFSAQQRTVMQASALYRGVFAPGEPPMTPYGPAFADFQEGVRLATPEQHADARAALAARPATTRLPWGFDLPGSVRGYLEGIGCPTGSNYYDELDVMLSREQVGPEALFDVAWDVDAPVIARRRALSMLARAERVGSGAGVDLEAVRWIVVDESEPALVRSAALTVLEQAADPNVRADARSLAEGFASHHDRKLARLTRRFR